MRRPRTFPTWLALALVLLLSLFAGTASAQTTSSYTTATVQVMDMPPDKDFSMRDFTLPGSDLYTINVPAPMARLAQGTTTVSPWSGAFFWDIRSNTLDAVALNKILDLTKNTKLSGFSLYAFAGTTVDKQGKAVAGLAIGKDWKWFDQVSFFTGVGASFSASQPVGGGFIVGASIKF